MAAPFKVLIVDDSDLTREALRKVLELDRRLKVIAEAKTGEQALDLALSLQPDLITMDLSMPGMGGLKAIEKIMAARPVPLVVISERSPRKGEDLVFEALSRGALELVPKSAIFGGDSSVLARFAEQMAKIADSGVVSDRRVKAPDPRPPRSGPAKLVGLGASTGGPKALSTVLHALPKSFPTPVLVVQHMAPDFFDSFLHYLNERSGLPVVRAEHEQKLLPGKVYLGAPGKHLTVTAQLTVRLEPPKNALHCPSATALFESMAFAVGADGAGALLTGMGNDGAHGLLALRQAGARTAVQDAKTSAVFGMPQAALELGAADEVLPIEKVAGWLMEQVQLAKPSPAGDSPLADAVLQAAEASPARKRILVVDDSPIVLESTRVTLEGAGFEVKTLDNPLMVPSAMRREHFDLVMLDVSMPVVQGDQVMRALKGHELSNAPVILFSDRDESQLRELANSCGAAGWLRKSAGPRALVDTVKRYAK